MSVFAFIQARVGSTRLPAKVLLDLCGKPVLTRVIERLQRAKGIDKVVVVTTIEVKDLPLVQLCAKLGVQSFCGSEDDVLDRFYKAALIHKPEHVVRITADCPVMDTAVVESVVRRHVVSGADYTTNCMIERFPDGEDVEVMTFESLRRAWQESTLASEREHVTLYFRNHPELFRLESVEYETDLSKQRWTLDTERDYRFLDSLYRELSTEDEFFGMDKILELLAKKPELLELNSGIARNEGLKKSLREDLTVAESRLNGDYPRSLP